MEKFILLLTTLLISISVSAGNLDSSPKDLVIQESLAQKIKITLPEIDLNDYQWSCHEPDTPAYCNVKYVGKSIFVVIGNSRYYVNFRLYSGYYGYETDEDLSSTKITWNDFKNGKLKGILVTFNEVETGHEYSLDIDKNYVSFRDHSREGGSGVKLISNY